MIERRSQRKKIHGIGGPRERMPCSFYKIMLPSILHHKIMRIPEEFVRGFGSRLSDPITLEVPNGQNWHVGLEKNEDGLWFCNGWGKFLECYGIGCAYFLTFKYEGKSNFRVCIFEPSGSEICYPYSKQSLAPKLESTTDDDDSSIEILEPPLSDPSDVEVVQEERKDKFQPCDKEPMDAGSELEADDGDLDCNIPNDADVARSVKEEKEFECRRSKRRKSNSDMGRTLPNAVEGDVSGSLATEMNYTKSTIVQRVKHAERIAGVFKLKNPFFVTFLKAYHLEAGNCVHVPTAFAKEYLNASIRSVKLESSDDSRRWEVGCLCRKGRILSLTRGWQTFARECNLEAGDVCVFELIHLKRPVFKVHVSKDVDKEIIDI